MHTVKDLVGNYDGEGDLCDLAAAQAIKVLAGNWADALRDGYTLAELLPDVDGVINVLKAWKEDAKNGHKTQRS